MDEILTSKTPLMITRYAINSYAQMTDNHHPVYLDRETAAEWGLANNLVPSCFFGQLAFSKIILGQVDYIPTGGVHIKQQYKFYRPVYEGDKISINLKKVQYEDAKGRTILEYRLEFSNQHQKIVGRSIMVNLLPDCKRG